MTLLELQNKIKDLIKEYPQLEHMPVIYTFENKVFKLLEEEPSFTYARSFSDEYLELDFNTEEINCVCIN